MTFIRGVLARARGEASQIRPRRDLPGGALEVPPARDTPSPSSASTLSPHATAPVTPPLADLAPLSPAATRLAHPVPDTVMRGPTAVPPSSDDEAPVAPLSTSGMPRAMFETAATMHATATPAREPNTMDSIRRRDDRAASPAQSSLARATVPAQSDSVPAASGRPARADYAQNNPENNPNRRAATDSAPQTRVDIHIGKLEVTAPAAPRATHASPGSKPRPTPLTLDEYLAARSARR